MTRKTNHYRPRKGAQLKEIIMKTLIAIAALTLMASVAQAQYNSPYTSPYTKWDKPMVNKPVPYTSTTFMGTTTHRFNNGTSLSCTTFMGTTSCN